MGLKAGWDSEPLHGRRFRYLTLAAAVRARVDCRVVVGGVHVTHVPEVVVDHPVLDAAVLGEGEQTFAEFKAARS